MNTIKRINLSIAVLITTLFFLTGSLSAQQRRGQVPPPIPDEAQINKMVDELSTELSLSEVQKTEILSMYNEHFGEGKTLMNSGKKPSRKEMEILRTNFENKVKSLLNDEQKELFEEYIKNNKHQQGNGGREQQQRR